MEEKRDPTDTEEAQTSTISPTGLERAPTILWVSLRFMRINLG